MTGAAAAATPIQISGYQIEGANQEPLASGASLTAGQTYYLSMTADSSAATQLTPLFLVEALQGGQVLSLGSVQSTLDAGSSATVTVSFTPQVRRAASTCSSWPGATGSSWAGPRWRPC